MKVKGSDGAYFDWKEDTKGPAEVVALPLVLEHLDNLMELLASEYPAL